MVHGAWVRAHLVAQELQFPNVSLESSPVDFGVRARMQNAAILIAGERSIPTIIEAGARANLPTEGVHIIFRPSVGRWRANWGKASGFAHPILALLLILRRQQR
jgi:hypothetical protein